MEIDRNCVYLIGAGPGDPDLLTLKAARIIAAADVVVYDHLVGQGVLALIPAHSERIDVGKEAGHHPVPQERISRILVGLGRKGGTVVRLKGGDPYIFGRGGEEAAALARAGIGFQVVPGITAASGMAAYAGIPLTHRDYAQSCLFVTGHLKDGHLDLDWAALSRPRQTVVIYMGISGIDEICRRLMAYGLPGGTPAAVVRNATLCDQQVVTADVSRLASACHGAGIRPPALIVIGAVVSLAPQLDWFSIAGSHCLPGRNGPGPGILDCHQGV
ncbi:MAG: uroporphyrinogen-III C-methyltransferase [Rhodocyclaceae bacterium]|jgi:uroporphyrin-III C-methyltransferase|nr:uroporphyrinogen-III C-methyltransferase [Rhodocyclaceae bacterium]